MSAVLQPRLIRYKDAPSYVGVARNKFDAEWRPLLTSELFLGTEYYFDRVEMAALARERGIPIPEPVPPPPPPWTLFDAVAELQANAAERRRRAAMILFHANKRRAAKLQRTPPWADMDAMRELYAEAKRLEYETGKPHHVDHVIPLQGKLVSGLHVHTNMQVIPASENNRKHNKYEVEQ